MRKKAPNFLLPWQYERFPYSSVFFLGVLVVFFIMLVQINAAIAVLLFGAGFVFFLSLHLEWGLYGLMLLGFFHGWVIDLSQYQSLQRIPYLGGTNAPAVDFFAILLFAAVLTSVAFRFAPIYWRTALHMLPGWQWYGLFLLVGAASLSRVFDHDIAGGVKYLLRPMFFVYAMFVGLVCFVMQRKRVLARVLRIWFWVGSAIALFGAIAFFRAFGSGGWPRVAPFGIGGVAPLGYNHNLLAEVLVVIIPIGIYLAAKGKRHMRGWYIVGTAGMVAIALLTLSRAAWISLGVGSLFILYWYHKAIVGWFNKHGQAAYLAGIGALAVAVYMIFFLGSNIVTSSNEARIVSTDVALFYAARSPIVGNGPGTFIPILANTELFTLDFGDPLDAHGFIQKIILEEGIVGLVFFCLFLFFVLRVLWRKQADKKNRFLFHMLFLCALGAILFQLFNTSYFNANMWLPIGLALAAAQMTTFGENYAFKK